MNYSNRLASTASLLYLLAAQRYDAKQDPVALEVMLHESNVENRRNLITSRCLDVASCRLLLQAQYLNYGKI